MTSTRKRQVVALQIDEDHRITADDMGYMLERRAVSKKGVARWRGEAYYTSPGGAMRGAWELGCRAISAESIDELIRRYEEAGRRLERAAERWAR